MTTAKDWTGQKFGRLTFIKPTAQKSSMGIKWETLCDCGKTTIVSPRNVKGIGPQAKTQSCGCLGREQRRLYDPVESSARDVHRRYNDGDISFEDFYRLSQQACHYCGALPSTTYNYGSRPSRLARTSALQQTQGNFIYNGLDRVDSSKGHTLDNVVPCCWLCNLWKSRLSVEEFLLHNERIYLHAHPSVVTP